MIINEFLENGVTYTLVPLEGSVTLTPLDSDGNVIGKSFTFNKQKNYVAVSDYYNAEGQYTITLAAERGAGLIGEEVDLSNIEQSVNIDGNLTVTGGVCSGVRIEAPQINGAVATLNTLDSTNINVNGPIVAGTVEATSVIKADYFNFQNGEVDGLMTAAAVHATSLISSDSFFFTSGNVSKITGDELTFHQITSDGKITASTIQADGIFVSTMTTEEIVGIDSPEGMVLSSEDTLNNKEGTVTLKPYEIELKVNTTKFTVSDGTVNASCLNFLVNGTPIHDSVLEIINTVNTTYSGADDKLSIPDTNITSYGVTEVNTQTGWTDFANAQEGSLYGYFNIDLTNLSFVNNINPRLIKRELWIKMPELSAADVAGVNISFPSTWTWNGEQPESYSFGKTYRYALTHVGSCIIAELLMDF